MIKENKYTKPEIVVIRVELELGISATSGTATFIGPAASENTPIVDAWTGIQSDGTVEEW